VRQSANLWQHRRNVEPAHLPHLGRHRRPGERATPENSLSVVHRTILTYDGLQSAPDDGLRRELLGGELYVSPAPSPLHQRAVRDVLIALDAYARRHGGEALDSPIDVVFSQTDAVQPDVIYFTAERLTLIGTKYIAGAPSLVVEVISPSSSDVDPGRKLETYARYGVPEYWIVDPVARTITAHARPSGDNYLRTSTGASAIESLTLPDLTFALT
jgi:Uma2 family endonuclease